MNEKKILLTADGLKKYQDELEMLKTEKRKEVSERLKEAISFGDLSENAEYDAAKNLQAEVEERIFKLEQMLKNYELIQEEKSEQVKIGSKVIIFDEEFEEELEYTIVGATEAAPFEGKISNESPVGSALLEKSVGDMVEVEAPDGVINYKILKIK